MRSSVKEENREIGPDRRRRERPPALGEEVRGERLLLALSQAAQAIQQARSSQAVHQAIGAEIASLDFRSAVVLLAKGQTHLEISYVAAEPDLLAMLEEAFGCPYCDYRIAVQSGDRLLQRLISGEAVFSESPAGFIENYLPESLRPIAWRVAGLLGQEHYIAAPLRVGGEAYGFLLVGGAGLARQDVAAMIAFANQAAIAIENARLYESERNAREQSRALTEHLEAAREEERTRIAREIHDEFGQVLTALKMDLSWFARQLPAGKPRLQAKIEAMSGLIDETIQTVRRIATELRPGVLDDLGLPAAIEWQAEEFTRRTGIACYVRLSHEEMALERELATALFRILQEALTNVARHAGATRVTVALEQKSREAGGELVLTICDNGRGITASQIDDPQSLGLIGMHERARSWAGTVTFGSVAGRGTRVRVCIPPRWAGRA